MKFALINKIEELDSDFQRHYNQFSSETRQTAQTYTRMLEDNSKTSRDIAGLNRDIER